MTSLATIYRPYFPVGAAVEPETLTTQGSLLVSQVNSVVAENAMKWECIHPSSGSGPAAYDFRRADTIVEFASRHGWSVRGHNLVWHQQCPSWVFQEGAGSASRERVLGRMREHIAALLVHFRGSVYCWDVVNEALSERAGSWRVDSPWFRAAGAEVDGTGVPEYVLRAFQYARAADPSVQLFYNDYRIESGDKLRGALELVRALRSKGLIDGVGIQGHWTIFEPDPEDVRHAIVSFASLGVKVQITELDLSVFRSGDSASLPALPSELERRQAKQYGALFKVFREEAQAGRLSGVTFWGIADDHTWLDDYPVKGRKDWPLLFDTAQRPKSAYGTVTQW